MELLAVIRAINFLQDHYKEITAIKIYSDSQYVTGLEQRKEKFISLGFESKKGKPLHNADLVKQLLTMYESYSVETVKIKAHQKRNGINDFNIEADVLSRKLVREALK
jgi:ribonuclease HI